VNGASFEFTPQNSQVCLSYGPPLFSDTVNLTIANESNFAIIAGSDTPSTGICPHVRRSGRQHRDVRLWRYHTRLAESDRPVLRSLSRPRTFCSRSCRPRAYERGKWSKSHPTELLARDRRNQEFQQLDEVIDRVRHTMSPMRRKVPAFSRRNARLRASLASAGSPSDWRPRN